MGLASKEKIYSQQAGNHRSDPPLELLNENTPLSLSTYLTEEYAILAGIATNLRSGFLLLNQAEALAYANPISQNLLNIERNLPSIQQLFYVLQQLVQPSRKPTSAPPQL